MANKAKKEDSNTQTAGDGWLRRHWRPVTILIVLVLLVAGAWRVQSDATDASAANAATTATTTAALSGSHTPPGSAAGALGADGSVALTPEQRAQQLIDLKKQLELAQHTYNTYAASTKYPQASRPIAEHPDQVYPNRPIEIDNPLHKKNGQVDPGIKIKTTQTRVFVASKETVSFSLTAVDSAGNSQPLFITGAIARGIANAGSRAAAQVTMQFADDGSNGDLQASDGIVTGTLNPSATSFANFNGTIRTEVNFNVGDSAGFVLFDIIYTPETPATWTGQIRDAVEAGSLNFYLKANVNQAGRYLVSARVDDAQGKPFALVSFNDLLQEGQQDIKLPLFGKLISDQNPTFPLTLRDVDAYLLKENTDPDRALMPRLPGKVYVTKKYPVTSFSSAEWTSEERTRYLTELGKDVNQAKAALGQAQGQP
jgi:hypothetical protein